MRAALLLGVALLTLPGAVRAESLTIGTTIVGGAGVSGGLSARAIVPVDYAQEVRERVKVAEQQTLDYARSHNAEAPDVACRHGPCGPTMTSRSVPSMSSGTNTVQTNGCLKYRSDGSFMTVPCEAITPQPFPPKELDYPTLTQPKKGTTTMEFLGGIFLGLLALSSVFSAICFVNYVYEHIKDLEKKIKEWEAAEGATEEEILRVAEAIGSNHDKARAAIIALRAV